jgi:hypothetical protein
VLHEMLDRQIDRDRQRRCWNCIRPKGTFRDSIPDGDLQKREPRTTLGALVPGRGLRIVRLTRALAGLIGNRVIRGCAHMRQSFNRPVVGADVSPLFSFEAQP